MKQFFFLVLLISQFNLSSQIGPCSIEGGRQSLDLYFGVDHLPDEFDLGSVGENNLWLFTSLQSPRTGTYRYSKATEGRYHSYFEEAEMVLREPLGKEIFFMTRGNRWYTLGYVQFKDASIEPEVVRYTVPIVACIPRDYNNAYTYQTSYSIGDKKINTIYKDIKDAQGVLYLSDGIYDAFRVKREVIEVAEGMEKIYVSYVFVDQLTEEFLMEVNLDDTGSPKLITYKTQHPVTPRMSLSGTNQFLLYPDVGYGEVRLEFNNFNPGYYSFVVFDVIGRKLWSKNYLIENDITIKENLSFLPRGRYHYTIIDSNQNKIVTRRLAIIKS